MGTDLSRSEVVAHKVVDQKHPAENGASVPPVSQAILRVNAPYPAVRSDPDSERNKVEHGNVEPSHATRSLASLFPNLSRAAIVENGRRFAQLRRSLHAIPQALSRCITSDERLQSQSLLMKHRIAVERKTVPLRFST